MDKGLINIVLWRSEPLFSIPATLLYNANPMRRKPMALLNDWLEGLKSI